MVKRSAGTRKKSLVIFHNMYESYIVQGKFESIRLHFEMKREDRISVTFFTG